MGNLKGDTCRDCKYFGKDMNCYVCDLNGMKTIIPSKDMCDSFELEECEGLREYHNTI